MSHFVFMNTQKMFGLKKSDICLEQETGKWKVSVNKTFMHVQEQKKRCHRDIPLTLRLV